MQEQISVLLFASLAAFAVAAEDGLAWMRKLQYCDSGQPWLSDNYTAPLQSFGFVNYQDFDTLDVMGPLEALQTLARKVRVDVAFIGETLDPVSPKPVGMELLSPSAWQSVLPTHTYANPPDDLEVLFVPGVSAGIDDTLAFLECIFGTAITTWVAEQMEYERHTNRHWDPFADIFNVTDA